MFASEGYYNFNLAGRQDIGTAEPVPEELPASAFDVDWNSTLGAAVWYAARMGWPVFPIRDRKPATAHGHLDASRDPEQLRVWFQSRWGAEWLPDIAVATGTGSSLVIIDIDCKPGGANGLDSLEEHFGITISPETPIAHTPSGGQHWFLQHPGPEWFVKSVAGWIPGCDVKADRSSCSVPPARGRRWDQHLNLLSTPIAELPLWVPRERSRRASAEVEAKRSAPVSRIHPSSRIHPYSRTALENACRCIVDAGDGCQQSTLNREAFSIGRLCGGGEIEVDTAKRMLLLAAERMRAYREPWPRPDLESIIDRALAEGQRRPRERPRR